MKYYDIMDGEEKGYFIEFESQYEAQKWLDDTKKRFPEYVERNGMHIVENERQTIGEKCIEMERTIEAQQKEIEQLDKDRINAQRLLEAGQVSIMEVVVE